MRNFDFLKNEHAFHTLYSYCSAAEEFQYSDPEKSALNSRKALEYLVRCIYLLNKYETSEKASLFELVDDEQFKKFLGFDSYDLLKRLHYIRKAGNNAAHIGKISRSEAFFSLVNLHAFTSAVLKKLGLIKGEIPPFDKNLIPKTPETPLLSIVSDAVPTEEVVSGLTPTPQLTEPIPAPADISEAETRKLFIDQLLEEAKWDIVEKKGAIVPLKACIEIAIEGMPNQHNVGFADYVLFGANGKPLAVVEAKRTSVNTDKGRHQATLYADGLEKKYHVRPIIYLSNGYHTKIIDGIYPEREVYGFHTAEELDLLIKKRNRHEINDFHVDPNITDREYQRRAIKAVCEHYNKNKRRALLVMATGTGKTRTAVSLVDVLIRNGWLKNILFLADRTSLVSQALRKGFAKFLPSMTYCELSDHGNNEKDFDARVVLSTYQTMINYIDADKKDFGIGRFDLVIIDEAHRSVFGKYGSIFAYFDSLLLGLTATPRDEVDRSTYTLFGLEDGCPNFAYELDEAVEEGYLVPYKAYKKETLFLKEGMKYADRTDEEKHQLEDVWAYEEIEGRDIRNTEMFSYIFNEDTIDKMLIDLMDNGLKVQDGQILGKTIIFASSHTQAEMIVKRFGALYPEYGSEFCLLIDNYVNYAKDLINRFENRNSLPQIAVSVDMLDTGIDVEDILNLVFYKVVKSKIKFNQMIGRGTRLSPNIFGEGKDKEYFKIFDWCGNFEYFDLHTEGEEGRVSMSLSERIFSLKCDIAFLLQKSEHQKDAFAKSLHDALKAELHDAVANLNDSRISVRMNMEQIDKFRKEEAWQYISPLDVSVLKSRIAPLLVDASKNIAALRFDVLILLLELSLLDESGSSVSTGTTKKSKGKVVGIARKLEDMASIPQVLAKMDMIHEVLTPNFWEDLSLSKLEKIRVELRELVMFLEGDSGKTFVTDIDDVVIDGGEVDVMLSPMTYKQKVFDFLEENENLPVLTKIKHVQQLSKEDIDELEDILWNKLGSKDEYEKYVSRMSCGDNVGIFIRSCIGVDRKVALQKFGEFIANDNLNSQQEEYLKSIINYVCENGDISRDSLVNEDPFSEYDWFGTFGDNAGAVVKYVTTLHDVVVA